MSRPSLRESDLLSIEDVQGVQVLEGEQDVGGVELRSILLEPSDLTQVEEKFASGAVFETEVQLAFRLEGVVHPDNELVVHTFLHTSQSEKELQSEFTSRAPLL